MNRRLLPLIAIAFLISGASSMVLYRFVAPRISAKPGPPPQEVVVAARTLEPGVLIRASDVRMEARQGAIAPGVARMADDAVGRGVVAVIYAGEPVHTGRLASEGAGAGLAALIPKGMRAVAVKVNDVVGVAGFVLPGMRVDVLIAGRPPNADIQQSGTVSRTLLQNVQVLSAGERLHKDADGKPVQAAVVNLMVTPEEAEMLSLAGAETRIQLVLRNPLDVERARRPGTAVAKLFEHEARLAPELPPRRRAASHRAQSSATAPAPQPAPFVMEILHGTKRTESRF
jgi:pilus assembly protein CpaB